MQASRESNELIHYGCGLTAPSGWRNFDASPTLRAQRLPVIGGLFKRIGVTFPPNAEYGDVTRRLPVSEGSARLVYCSHVLEHLPLEGLRAALAETFRVLKPGGTFRLVLPDLEHIVDAYKASDADDAAIKFMQDTILGQESRPSGLAATARDILGNSQHRWMWDYKSLASELRAAGFVDIRRAAFGDNDDPALATVEAEDRWEASVGIECRKP